MTSSALRERIERGQREHGERFNPGGLLGVCSCIHDAYASQMRVRVTTSYADGEPHTRTGVVSTTGGWGPCFLLMHRSNAHGSWDTINGTHTHVVACKAPGARAYRDGTPYGREHSRCPECTNGWLDDNTQCGDCGGTGRLTAQQPVV